MGIASSTAYKGITRFTLSNHLVLITQPDSFLPIVSLRGSFRSGSATEPIERGGELKMLTALLRSGTSDRNAVQIAQALDDMGSSISFNVHHDAVHFSLSSLGKHFPASFSLLTDLVFHSVFPEEEIERQRKAMLADLRKKVDQPSLLSWEVFNHFVYGDHPYRRSVDGNENSVGTLSREHILANYRDRFKPSQAILAIAGDFDPKDVLSMINQSAWNQTGEGGQMTVAVSEPEAQPCRIVLVDRDLTQANICLGNLGARRKSEDYHASVMMNYVLGGSGLVSRLTHTIRTERGLAYSVYSSMTRRLYGGTFSVHLQTKNESAADAIRLIESEMIRLREQSVSEAEWNDTRSFFKGSFPFRLETNSNLAFYLEQAEFYDLGLDALDREIEELMRLTPVDVLQAAQKHLQVDRSTIVVTGKKDQLWSRLGSLGPIVEVDHRTMEVRT